MIGPVTYRIWTAAFTEGSYFGRHPGQGRAHAVPGARWPRHGLGDRRARPQEFISIKHLGEIKDGVEDTESEAVRSWTPCFETYTFTQLGMATELTVDMDMAESFEEHMTGVWA